ncbi:DJ-1/YajL/PfpI superfamily, includes chaperone protein YajL (former ThiJ), parkinsonism-associated protein DJ-1, peptidases PfpI, Hsp31 [Olavius algarvensis associated proteobacterium Delta 3]|nr:DJ-1/YajL/PfpI superfamily, includes chaperone protein YajL (former ThiJ), parkinsonism-associated protein DJ-1, peptidases PfpI, Hsp31 [Olavius algarvensis associated proteobacterium Delta 3]CAB5097879.1 DJ-1/YajL/PfpI superfamily, includes chaperone protein YajL (former ThiJ), parkinsonism-associated protein DJ-1, peptidases PfpI, Hsp31 [Olavius algarvensis associated proteobacterium Delta 3]
MAKKVLVPIADGTEEIEAVCIIDVLRRAGADVTLASVDGLQITASRGVKIIADCLIYDCLTTDYDLIVVPGGMPGAERLSDADAVVRLLQGQRRKERLYGAICAAPAVVLEPHGLLEDRRATSHPSFADRLTDQSAIGSRVVVDGNVVTSQGPGTAIEFALKLVELLFGKEKADEVAEPLMVP